MEAEAKINFDYVWRKALFSVVIIGWGLWSVYDGVIGYPNFNLNHDYAQYKELRAQCREEVQEGGGQELTAFEQREAMHSLWASTYRPRFKKYLQSTEWWDEFNDDFEGENASDNGEMEAVKHLEDSYYSTWDIRGQFIMAIICLPLGLLTGGFLLRNYRRHFRADPEGLHGFGPRVIPYAAIESIDWSKWDNKGIAKLHVRRDNRTRDVVLDDWKFKGMTDILDIIKDRRPELAPEEDDEVEST